MQTKAFLLLASLSVSAPATLRAQVLRAGPEFQVNEYTTGSQGAYPTVTMGANGGFVIVWASPQDADSSLAIMGRRFDASGTALGGEFQINTYTTDFQYLPRVAADAAGDFVVVWGSSGEDGDGAGIAARRFDSAGTPLGAD